jgi:hypothetical protein
MHGFKEKQIERQATAEQICKLFTGNEIGHCTFKQLKQEGEVLKCDLCGYADGPPTAQEWEWHLYGTSGIGVAPIRQDGTVYFGCIDLDTHGVNAADFDLINLLRQIERKKLPLLPVYSKSGGLHLFVFFKEPVEAELVRRVLASWAKALLFPDDVEIFPKQDDVNDAGKGSNLWMPYYGHWSNNKELPAQEMVHGHGVRHNVEGFLFTANEQAITGDEFAKLEKKAPGRPRKHPKEERQGPRYGTREWAEAKLASCCEQIQHAVPGNLNNTVTQECFFPGRMVGGGLLDDGETWNRLSQAITSNGHHDQKMLEAGRRSYDAGMADPLDYTAKRDGPVIRIEPNQVADTVDQIEHALIQGNRNLYQRGGKIVYPCQIKGMSHNGEETYTPGIDNVSPNRLFEFADSVAIYERYSASTDQWTLCDAPRALVAVLLERGGDLRLPVLRAIVNTPLVFPDGRILDTPGYDAASGLLYDPQGVEWAAVPEHPTKDDAVAALRVVNEPLAHYRFKDDGDGDSADAGGEGKERGLVSRSVAHSLMITGVVRATLDLAPGYAISATDIGAGKGKLVALASVLAVNDIPRTITQGKDGEEFEKRLVAELRVNTGMISIGNCRQPIRGDFIEEFLTNKRVHPRILGLSESITVDNTNLVVWNGNNLLVIGDTVRRFVRVYIDPGVEFAYRQVFPFDPVDYARDHRVRIVTAILTLLRAYAVSEDKPALEPLHNFDLWSQFVRGAIVWAGGADPVLSQSKIVEEDETRLELARIMAGWEESMGTDKFFRLEEVAAEASEWHFGGSTYDRGRPKWPEFYDALEDIAVFDKSNKISTKKLGHWLKTKANAIVDSKTFVRMYNTDRKAYDWMLKTVK